MTPSDNETLVDPLGRLLRRWEARGDRETWRKAVEHMRAKGDPEGLRVAELKLSSLPQVSALEALSANAEAVRILTGRRWYAILWAREEGSTWAEIATALQTTEAEVLAFYRSSIAAQEQLVRDLHDASRARAVLPEGPPSGSGPPGAR